MEPDVELTLAYTQLESEREERRGLETRAAATIAAVLTMAVVGATAVRVLHGDKSIQGTSARLLEIAALLGGLTVLAVSCSLMTPTTGDLKGVRKLLDCLGLSFRTPEGVRRRPAGEGRREDPPDVSKLHADISWLTQQNQRRVLWLKLANVLLAAAAGLLVVGLWAYA